MSHGGIANLATRLAGMIVLAIGLAHIFLPEFGYATADLVAVPDPQREHFVLLGTYAIASFLLTFAVMTLLADRNSTSVQTTIFLGLMTVVWGVRIALEIIYPVRLALFGISSPHPALLVVTAIVCGAYAIGFVGHLESLRSRYPELAR